MFSFFSSKPQFFPIASYLETDMHAHFLPGIDDGAPDVEASINLLSGLSELGFKRFVATPHVMSDLYPNTIETIDAAADRLNHGLISQGLHFDYTYSAEYLLDEGFEDLLAQEKLININKTKHILVETAFLAEPPNLMHLLFALQAANFRPILAHPERYRFLYDNLPRAIEFREKGFLLQTNILSLVGYYGKAEKQTAIRLLEADVIDYLGTDIHHNRHLRALQNYRLDRKIIRLLEKKDFSNHDLFLVNQQTS